MREWPTRALGELADIRISNVDKKSVPGEMTVRLCNYMDAYANDYIRSDIDFMQATASASEIARFSVVAGDVVLTKDSETPDDIGIPAVVMDQIDDLVCGYHLVLLKTKQDLIDPVFLCKQLGTSRAAQYFGQRATGSTRYGLPNRALATFQIPVPPLAVQKTIARVLQAIDTAIEKTEALIAKHQQIKAGLMHDLFTRGVLPNGQLRPPRSAAPELYQETAIGWIPEDWQLSTLRQCLTDSPTNGIYKPAEQIGEGLLMVGQTAFTEQRSIDFTLCRRGAVDKVEAYRYGLAKDDILVTRVFATVEGVGLPTLVPQLVEPAVFESNMMRLRIDVSIVKPRLLFEWLQSPIARRHITGGANASNQCSVNQGVLNPLPVVLPPLDEQTRITVLIEQADRQREGIIESLSKLKMQKLGLMQDLLTGRVSVPAAPEPAEATA